MPPTTLTTKRHEACQSENVPVITAVTAKPYATSAVASLIRLSPSMIATSRRGTPSLEAMAVAATASVGATIAPITKHVGQERPEIPSWQAAATVTIVTSTRPMARNDSGRAFRRSSRSDVKNALA